MIRRYWDSDVFLGWLNGELGRSVICDAILEDAKLRQCEILTSTITFAEVFYVKPTSNQDQSTIEALTDLFGRSWIIPVILDRLTAELARDLLFEFSKTEGLKPQDAIHLASAMRAQALGNVSIFETWDGGLIHIGTQLHRVANVKGATRVKIANPTGQQRLQPVPIIAESE